MDIAFMNASAWNLVYVFGKRFAQYSGIQKSYCGEERSTPVKIKVSPSAITIQRFKIAVQVAYNNLNLCADGMMDWGTAGNFVSSQLAWWLKVPVYRLNNPLAVAALDGKPLGSSGILHQSAAISLCVQEHHQEELSLLILPYSSHPIILGLPWLLQQNPIISWHTRCLTFRPPTSARHCGPLPVASTSVESPDQMTQPDIPREYWELKEVFSKTTATQLPPHLSWNHSIQLLSGASPPRSHVYPLSVAETQAMEKYVQAAFQQGFIRPSTSPASASLFFVQKKDGGLCPCIDYRGLNEVMVRYRYPLSMVPCAVKQLSGAKIFSKLNLHSAYNLISIWKEDEWKTAFSTNLGYYEYCMMPYGLVNTPSVFQSFINDVLREMLNV